MEKHSTLNLTIITNPKDEWLQNNVINNLKFKEPKQDEDEYYVATRSEENKIPNDIYKSFSLELRDKTSVIKHQLLQWLEQFDQVEMWSDCLSYDWFYLIKYLDMLLIFLKMFITYHLIFAHYSKPKESTLIFQEKNFQI